MSDTDTIRDAGAIIERLRRQLDEASDALRAAGYDGEDLGHQVTLIISSAQRRGEMADDLGDELMKADATIADLTRRLG